MGFAPAELTIAKHSPANSARTTADRQNFPWQLKEGCSGESLERIAANRHIPPLYGSSSNIGNDSERPRESLLKGDNSDIPSAKDYFERLIRTWN